MAGSAASTCSTSLTPKTLGRWPTRTGRRVDVPASRRSGCATTSATRRTPTTKTHQNSPATRSPLSQQAALRGPIPAWCHPTIPRPSSRASTPLGPGWPVPDVGLRILELFLERLDLWEEQENQPPDLLIIVATWIQSRMDDPFEGAERVDGFEDLWFAVVPNSHDGGRVVTC